MQPLPAQFDHFVELAQRFGVQRFLAFRCSIEPRQIPVIFRDPAVPTLGHNSFAPLGPRFVDDVARVAAQTFSQRGALRFGIIIDRAIERMERGGAGSMREAGRRGDQEQCRSLLGGRMAVGDGLEKA